MEERVNYGKSTWFMGQQHRLPACSHRLCGRPRQYLGLSVQDGQIRRLHVPARLSVPGDLRRSDHHGLGACPRPKDQKGSYRRLQSGVEQVFLARLVRGALAVPDHDLLLGPGRLLHLLHHHQPAWPLQGHAGQQLLRRDDHQHPGVHRRAGRLHGDLLFHRGRRRLRRHREVQQDRHACPVRDAAHHHRPLPDAPARGRGPEVHVHPRLCGRGRLHRRSAEPYHCSRYGRRPDVLLPVPGHGRHDHLRLLPRQGREPRQELRPRRASP